jgi:hypothetical protein
VPVLVAKIMTYPEMVNRHNMDRLKTAVRNGNDVHPGANLLRSKAGHVTSLDIRKRDFIADNLQVSLSLSWSWRVYFYIYFYIYIYIYIYTVGVLRTIK